MQEISEQNLKRYLFWALIAILLVMSYFILKSFLIPIISSFILAYMVMPIYNRLKPKLGTSLSAIVCIILIGIVIVVPLALILGNLVQQAYGTVDTSTLSSFIDRIPNLPFLSSLNINIESIREAGTAFLVFLLTSTAKAIPSLALSLLVLLFATYYALTNWSYITSALKDYIPFSNKEKIAKEIAYSTNHILYGYLLIAAIEFVIASIGFFISGVQFYLALAALIAFFAFVPGVGPGLVWGILAIINILTGNYYTAVGVIITGLVISLGVELFLFPRFIGHRAKIHPFLILLGILGGVPLFGVFGFIIGPLVLVYTIKLIHEGVNQQVK